MIKDYPFTVTKGHQVASGIATDSPFPDGTIALQAPKFKALGLDLTHYFKGTINAQFNCKSIELINWDLSFTNVQWLPEQRPESFHFAHAQIAFNGEQYPAIIYQPTKETKIGHFQTANTLELLAPKINGLKYDSNAVLKIESRYLHLD